MLMRAVMERIESEHVGLTTLVQSPDVVTVISWA